MLNASCVKTSVLAGPPKLASSNDWKVRNNSSHRQQSRELVSDWFYVRCFLSASLKKIRQALTRGESMHAQPIGGPQAEVRWSCTYASQRFCGPSTYV